MLITAAVGRDTPPQKSKNPNQEERTSTKLPKTEHCAVLSAKPPSVDMEIYL